MRQAELGTSAEVPRQHIAPQVSRYDPERDWINQRQLADLLGVAPETASRWSGDHKLKIFEHGMIGAGKRQYSRQLVQEYQQLKMSQARDRMREVLNEGERTAGDATA